MATSLCIEPFSDDDLKGNVNDPNIHATQTDKISFPTELTFSVENPDKAQEPVKC